MPLRGSSTRAVYRSRPTMKKLFFVSSNVNKFKEVQAILQDVAIVEHVSLELVELQTDQMDEIARHKAQQAVEQLKAPILVEDTCLGFDAWNGLPGTFVKYFFQKMKATGFSNLLCGSEDKGAVATCTFAYCPGDPDTIHIFTGQVHGQVVPPRGSLQFGWDCVFQPDGYDQVYGEMTKELKNTISHRNIALQKLKLFLKDS